MMYQKECRRRRLVGQKLLLVVVVGAITSFPPPHWRRAVEHVPLFRVPGFFLRIL